MSRESAERSGSGSVLAGMPHSPLAVPTEQRNVEARDVAQFLRQRVIDLEPGDDPGHRQRRHDRNDGELIELAADRHDAGRLLRGGRPIEELGEAARRPISDSRVPAITR